MRLITIALTLLLFLGNIKFSLVSASDLTYNSSDNVQKLALRQIDGYCDIPTDKFVCMGYNDYYGQPIDDTINQYLKLHKKEIEQITIENPSNIINLLKFRGLENLESIVIFGNDYDTDALHDLPKQLLKLPSLQSIEFDGVRFPHAELERIKNKFPNIEIIGKIADVD